MEYNKPTQTAGPRTTATSASEGRLKVGLPGSRRQGNRSLRRKVKKQIPSQAPAWGQKKGPNQPASTSVKTSPGLTPTPTKPMPIDRNIRPVTTPTRKPAVMPKPIDPDMQAKIDRLKSAGTKQQLPTAPGTGSADTTTTNNDRIKKIREMREMLSRRRGSRGKARGGRRMFDRWERRKKTPSSSLRYL